MPAKHLIRVVNENTYSHVYNTGIDNRDIFLDRADYEKFLEFIKEYLNNAPDRASIKTSFTVKGKTYQGTPHMPKNFVNKVELVAFRLMQNQFHLVLHQLSPSSQASFLRSLCTRYSMYFNKRYNRTGPLFAGPYKSIHISDPGSIAETCGGIFSLTDENYNPENVEKFSSYFEFIGKRNTPWIKSPVVLEGSLPEKKEVKSFKEPSPRSSSHTNFKIQAYAATSAFLYIVLTTIGILNIRTTRAYSDIENPKITAVMATPTPKSATNTTLVTSSPDPSPSITPSIAGVETESTSTPSPSLTPSTSPSIKQGQDESLSLQIIKIVLDGSTPNANLRNEATESAQIVGQAKEGQTFELLSKSDNWYQIMLEDGSTAFVSSLVAQVLGEGVRNDQ